ncbi:type VI secretion system contractile sheath large subunit [Alteromonas sp. ASW11-130]|uniref:type VI secretion system contractile sheath large subunit n=1 Tax=Alteromonas sp. ASW11-130 TaxID=3015775 RepID=UPI0022421BBE|nr:type VI secretion system contractile sheath large subunit [Alteromonas sp. ASW11-130]MCW8092783.1 type VI secretion system contractile sheath large subunit [Alteromonas sp. ASW11-130]
MTELEKQEVAAPEEVEESGSLLDQIMNQANIPRTDESYDVAEKGVQAFIIEMLKGENKDERVRKSIIDEMIAEVDKKLGTQLDEILHNESFQKMESAWRSLDFLCKRTNFRENNKIHILNASKEDLALDFDDAAEISESGFYKNVYTKEYGTFGGEPYSSIIANYEFDHSSPDVKLLQSLASVGAMAHAPVLAAASPKMFGCNDIQDLPKLNDIASIFEGPQYAKWRSLRESEDARYIGLTLPRFLLRLPYDSKENPVKSFNYDESIDEDHNKYCWGNTAFALATRLNDSFEKYRWCPNIIGPQSGGAMEDLPLHQYETMGQIETKIPTEVLVSDRREFELAEAGFIPLTYRRGSDNASFFSANSIQKPKYFGISKEGKEAETNYKLGTQLPYMYVVNRLAHYIKVLQRENVGTTMERLDIQNQLNTWIKQYVADQDGASADVRARRPLRHAAITVDDVEGEPGFYRVGMQVRPHFKYMGADFTLSLVGKLDK